MVCRHIKVHDSVSSLLWLIMIKSGRLFVWPRLSDPFVSQNPWIVCASYYSGEILGCAYIICSYGQIQIPWRQRITFPTKSCLVLYTFCASLLHSLNMGLIVSSQHILRLLFCCVLHILALIWIVLMALFCAAIWRDSVYLLRFALLSHVHVFWWEMSLVSRFAFYYFLVSTLNNIFFIEYT